MVLHGDPTNPGSPCCPVTGPRRRHRALPIWPWATSTPRGKWRPVAPCAPGRAAPWARGFDETGVKGVYICQISPQGAQATFRPLGGGRYEDLTLPAGPDPLASILAQLPPDTGRDVYRLTLTGESEPVDLDRLQNALSGRFFHLQLRDRDGPSPGTCGRERARIAWRGGIFRFCNRPLKTPPGRRPRPCAWRLASAAGFWRGRR